ncbi:MAG: transposase [Eubacterium sp.]
MKCECFSCISDLLDYLQNNLLSVYYCGLGVHTASNQHNERKFEYYWGYKNHILVDCITGLPIFELTTTADVSDSTVALDILSQTNSFLPVNECTFIADKGYDVKAIYNTVKDIYCG